MRDFSLAICSILIFALLGFDTNNETSIDDLNHGYEFNLGIGLGTGSGSGSGSGTGGGTGSGSGSGSGTGSGTGVTTVYLDPERQIIIDYTNLYAASGHNNHGWISDSLSGNFQKTGDCSCLHEIEIWSATSLTVDVEETVKKVRTRLDTEGVNGNKYASRNYGFGNNSPSNCNQKGFTWNQAPNIYVNDPNQKIQIAVIDDGFDAMESVYYNRLWQNTQFTNDPFLCQYNQEDNGLNVVNSGANIIPNEHGNSTASIIASRAPSNASIELMNIQVKNGSDGGSIFDLICGIYYAIEHQADIVNISMGYSGEMSNLLKNTIESASPTMFVTSAGNNGIENDHWPSGFSSFLSNVVSVGSIDEYGTRSSFSNLADIYAPGQQLIDIPTGQLKNGTSFATPFVSAAIAQILLQNNNPQPYTIRNILTGNTYCTAGNQLSVNIYEAPGNYNQCPYGYRTAQNTTQKEEETALQTNHKTLRSYPNPSRGTTTIAFTLETETPISLTMSDFSGNVIRLIASNELKSKGEHQIPIGLNGVKPGVYLISLQTEKKIETQKMIVQ